MKTLLLCTATYFSLASVALALPVKLDQAQLGQIVAGESDHNGNNNGNGNIGSRNGNNNGNNNTGSFNGSDNGNNNVGQ